MNAATGFLLAAALLMVAGCASEQPLQPPSTPPAPVEPKSAAEPMPSKDAARESTPPPEPAPPEPSPAEVLSDAQALEGSGETVWAKGFEGWLIKGLDGKLYEPYRPAVIERAQHALRNRGLYAGPVNGVLDAPTMKAIYAFQRATQTLQRCGIPTPRTRKMLEQGSHTDLPS